MIHRRLQNHHFTASELRGILLVVLGLATVGYFFGWWFVDGRLQNPWHWLILITMLAYTLTQILGNWLVYLATHHRRAEFQPPDPELTVDVYVTAYQEDPALIEKTLTAARDMRCPHQTYLLDDGSDPALEKMARRLGVGYLTREGSQDAKAGNLNAALPRTDGEIIVIFDIDHTPKPDFLARSLGYFNDPKVGFVQVMLTFSAEESEWVAQAAADTSLDFYNPTSIGADGLRSTTLIGSNALIRREALASIEGYQPGLAEDLATSVALHAAGWRSVYVPEPLAPGIAPPDLEAWFTQQLKWARGVFELLLTVYPRLYSRLATGQRISYGLRMTYYWVGSIVALHLGMAAVALLSGHTAVMSGLESYLRHLAPLGVMTLGIRQLALRRWQHQSIKRAGIQWRPVVLVIATWPVYTLAWLMSLMRLPLDFRPTPKARAQGISWLWLLPQMASVVVLLIGLIVAITQVGIRPYLLTYLAALGLIAVQLPLLWPGVRSNLGQGKVSTSKMTFPSKQKRDSLPTVRQVSSLSQPASKQKQVPVK